MSRFTFMRGTAAVMVLGAVVLVGGVALTSTRAAGEDKPKEKQSAGLKAVLSGVFPEQKIYSRATSDDKMIKPEKGEYITSADGKIAVLGAGMDKSPDNILKGIGVPNKTFRVVQVPFTFDQASTYLKSARNLEEKAQVIYFEDAGKSTYKPSGYMMPDGEKMLIKVDTDPSKRIEAISEIKALESMKKVHTLYVIFHIPANTQLKKLVMAGKTVEIDVEVK